MKNIFRKIASAAASFALAAAALPIFPLATTQASAASTYWKFDFGNGGVASGYTGVTASTSYSSSLGYGFSSGTSVADVSAAGSGALSDAVQFKNSTATGNYTFCADVPNGLYQVSVWLGNTNRTSVGIENMLQIVNMTGNNAYHTLQVPVTDGQLNICACAGKDGYAFTMSALEIKQISTQTHTNPTIWICGDSTVCNYYPLDTSVQGGWGQMLPQYIDTSEWQVMNMAASGQYAKGFVDAGQFTVVEKNGQPGDIYVISIGINDTNYSNATEYYETVTSMAKTAMAKGMRVILVKQQGRDSDITRSPMLSGRWFGGQLDTIGSELGLEVVDLFNIWQDWRLSINDTNPSPYYMDGDDLHPNRKGAMKLAEFMADAINNVEVIGEDFDEGTTVMFRNLNSGMYLSAEGGVAAEGTNVSQTGDGVVSAKNVWKLVPAGDDSSYYIYSMLDGGNTYMLDVAGMNAENGTNIGIWTNTNCDAQVFKLVKDGDYYHIATAVTDYKSYVGIAGGSKEEGGNAIEWENDRTDNQKWIMQYAQYQKEDPLPQGDLDGDGIITAKDLTLLKRQLNGKDTNVARKIASDLDSDVQVTSADAEVLASYLSKKTDAFGGMTYPAAEQNYISGVHENYNAGFTYSEYLNLDNNTMSAVTFCVNVPQDGNYTCNFNIANGSANARTMVYTVSGQSDIWMENFQSTGSWTTWKEYTIVLPFKAGVNYLTLRSTMAEGAPNLDYLRMTPTDEPVSQTVDPTEIEGDQPVIYIASDSVAQSYRASYAPQQGWGYNLGDYFTDDIAIANHAIAGRSSKKFYDEGRLQTILDAMKQGDYLIVCFGINDSGSANADRYAPVCGDVNNPTEGSYEYYMKYYIEGALAKGGTPILMSPTLSIKNASQPFSAGYRNYASACEQLAAKYKIPYYDLGAGMATQFNNTAFATVYSYYMGSVDGTGSTSSGDFTHLTETGASAVAKIVADGLSSVSSDLKKYRK